MREGGLFGIFGGQVNVTDGRYVYMRAPATADNQPLYNYTLMPTHMREMFGAGEFEGVELALPFSFTKGCRTLRTKGRAWNNPHTFKTVLYDLQTDPVQEQPIQDEEIEANMTE